MGDDDSRGRSVPRRGFLKGTGVGLAATVGASGLSAAATTYTTSDHTIESYDGTTLAATLYEPDETSPYPAILMTHGWGSNRDSSTVTRKADRYASNGYVVLTYDSRGFGDSGGDVGVDGPNEVDDASRLIDWLANRDTVQTESSNNPVVGMDGISYAGGIQLHTVTEDDRIDAIVPRIAWHNLNYSLAPHDVIKSDWPTLLTAAGQASANDATSRAYSIPLWEWYLEGVANNELPTDARDAFDARSVENQMDQMDVPTLLFQGWDDTLFKTTEALDTYQGLIDRSVETRLVFYEGGHAPEETTVSDAERTYMNDHALDFMDKHLKGESVSIPQVAYYLKQSETWREDDSFPPSDATDKTFTLSAVTDGNTTDLDNNLWWWDESYYAFEWTIESDIELVGEPDFDIWVYPEGPEERLFFELHHERNGSYRRINDVSEAYRVEGADTWHNVTFDFPALQRYFASGDTLRLVISIAHPQYLSSRESKGSLIGHDSDHPSAFTIPYRGVSGTASLTMDLSTGDRVHTELHNVPIYDAPDGNHLKDKVLYSTGRVIDGPTSADGSTWWDVRWWEDDEGFDGWVREDLLERGAGTSERLIVGDTIQVDDDLLSGLPIRDGPGLSYEKLDEAATLDTGRITNGPKWGADDTTQYVWWKVDYDASDNKTGWCRQDGLTKT